MIATKVFFPMSPGPNGGGLSRKAIFTAIDASLRRLGTDYVDLYQIHRWDSAHADRGDARGAARCREGRQGALPRRLVHVRLAVRKALALARQHGWTPFVSMQNLYNLLYREEEREMLPLCADAGIGVIPWSPLARGRLARPWDDETPRTKTDPYGKLLFAATEESDRKVVEQVVAIAAARGVPRAQVAIAWLAQKSVRHRADHRRLETPASRRCRRRARAQAHAEEIAQLEAPYVPHRGGRPFLRCCVRPAFP